MSNISSLLERCHALGATLIPSQGKLRVEAPHPLPDEVLAELREAKSEILAELKQPSHEHLVCWLLEEWRRTAIPTWRRILKESIESCDIHREEYARWMLNEVLEADDD